MATDRLILILIAISIVYNSIIGFFVMGRLGRVEYFLDKYLQNVRVALDNNKDDVE